MEMIKKIQLRHLGKTDILVTPIGLGVMELGGGGGLIGMAFPVIPQQEKNAIIKAALDGGINWFDTAEMYGAGVSERALATGLKAAGKSDRDVIVATKWSPFLPHGRQHPAYDRYPPGFPGRVQHRELHDTPAIQFLHPRKPR